ncbi:MFS transporter [Caldivirga maquilingensis]|uniref:Major facilitator superfamily MFS_1 n=1 Tax=Caldivirga maquilingensis (strain ATCC 700844 / DSM 13496 / JCM 10307 / IC-167) TaxID=397948 RepID=A8MC00_CALMQ|nr:MFS transporter [Caldivirga maquilingensis]ABW02784.1 major facilitator superfamily MFS_1 [Caldivirga maquilingensis IC-167]
MLINNAEYDLKYAYRAMVILASLAVIVMYIEGMLIPSLTEIEREFGVTSSQVSWVLSSYLLSGTVLLPIVGRLGDIYGKKRVLSAVVIIYAVAVTLTSVSPSFTYLIAFRGIQGIGVTMFALAFSLIREEFPRELIPRAQGLVSAAFGIGAAIALPLGAYISQYFGWRTTYHTAIPFVLLVAYLIVTRIKESRYRNPSAKVDLPGAAVLGIGLGLVVYGLTEAPIWGWTNPNTIITFLAALIFIGAFIAVERRREQPLINLSLLTRRNVLIANLAAMVAGFGLFLFEQSLIILLEEPKPVGFNLSIFDTGLYAIPMAVAQLIVAPVAGILITRIGARRMLMTGASIAALFSLITAAVAPLGLGALITSTTLAMAGVAAMNVSLINILVFSVEPQVMGVSTAMNSVFRNLGGTLGPAVAGSLESTFTSLVLMGILPGRNVPLLVTVPSMYAFQIGAVISALTVVTIGILAYFSVEVITWRNESQTVASLSQE